MYKNRLIKLKEKNEITQTQIADILGITRGQYCHYETEDEIIPLKYLNEICNYFNVSIDYILNFSNKLNYDSNNKEINLIISGNRLKNFRKSLNYTQDKLAQKLNVARSIVSKYEKGQFLISTHFLYDICKKYHISSDYLLGKIDYEPKLDNITS